MNNFSPLHIEATTLPDAWFQTVYKCIEKGREFKIDKGSYEGQKRLEFDYITIHIKKPGEKPLLPQIPAQYNLPNPVADDYLNEYLPYLMSGEKKEGEDYTYGERLCKAKVDFFKEYFFSIAPYEVIKSTKIWSGDSNWLLNQIEYIIYIYKTKGYRNNQMVLQIAQPSDLLLNDPPCLRHIDTRIQDGKLYFFPYFRSWDLWGGFPANLAAIQLMKEYMAAEIGVEDGEMIASSKGLHLYNYVWQLAEIIRGKKIEEFRGREINEHKN